MAKILVIEDDRELRSNLVDWLRSEHHLVDEAETGSHAAAFLETQLYDLLILDWNLPDTTGIQILKTLRQAGSPVRVLMLTGMDSIEDIETGFRQGTDDYLTKPFQFRELVARISALLRRPAVFNGALISIGHISLDTRTRRVCKDQEEVRLKPQEYLLLEFLLKHPNEILSIERLLRSVWNSDSEVSSSSVYTCVNRLRRKLDREDGTTIIQTIHGVGYQVLTE